MPTRLSTIGIVIATGILLSAGVDHGTGAAVTGTHAATALPAPRLAIVSRPGYLDIDGVSASAGQERALGRAADRQFGDADIRTEWRPGVALPAHWTRASRQLVDAITDTAYANAELTGDRLRLRAVTADHAGPLHAALAGLAGNGIRIDADVVGLAGPAGARHHCAGGGSRRSPARCRSPNPARTFGRHRLPCSTESSNSFATVAASPWKSPATVTHRATRRTTAR